VESRNHDLVNVTGQLENKLQANKFISFGEPILLNSKGMQTTIQD
jgi:hypothetical protein